MNAVRMINICDRGALMIHEWTLKKNTIKLFGTILRYKLKLTVIAAYLSYRNMVQYGQMMNQQIVQILGATDLTLIENGQRDWLNIYIYVALDRWFSLVSHTNIHKQQQQQKTGYKDTARM